VGDSITAADLTAVPLIYPGMLPAQIVGDNPRLKFFSENFKLGEGRERTRAWAAKLMAYDR